MKIAPSILSCDFSKIGEELSEVTKAGADLIHLDVMDGHFVPNISFGSGIIKSIRKYSHLPFETHLMISNPLKYIKTFATCGSDIITFHIESDSDPYKTIKEIKSFNKYVGISIKPETDIIKIFPYMPIIDIILVMTVEPGFGGQLFMEDQLSKIYKLREVIDANCFNCLIEVDGGINAETVKYVEVAGADICVAGSSIFKSSDILKAIEKLR